MLPALARVYGLTWPLIVDMPPLELAEFIKDLNRLAAVDEAPDEL